MKTPLAENEPERSVPIDIHVSEALVLLRAIRLLNLAPIPRHQEPPDYGNLYRVILDSATRIDPDHVAYMTRNDPVPHPSHRMKDYSASVPKSPWHSTVNKK